MSDSIASLRHKIGSAEELESVVRTMKAMAASSIGQYENAVRSLDDYYRTVQLGLVACFRQDKTPAVAGRVAQKATAAIGAIVFGSDQGLVGQFNEVMVEYAVDTLENLPGKKIVWAAGERIQSRLAETRLQPVAGFTLPNSINAITPLVGQILIELEAQREQGLIEQVYLFHNRPRTGSIYTPVSQQLLPLDETWLHTLAGINWPTKNLPEVMNSREQTLRALVREYLFVTLFRACAESLASENASRLAAMQRAEKNIDELLEDLNRTFHRLRQSGIDEELFDVVSGFEALTGT
ncbi:MAG: F0F1 ATP synthase subunit gamma [Alphaproteobacteria bacterium]